jgi:shikimate dehydrogenase
VLNAAVLGRPVGHSLSPVLHRTGYRVARLDDWRYTAHDVGEGELVAFVDGLDESWRGLSLTMPLKEVALGVATTVSSTARVTGAVNTLVRRGDLGWDAHNTDVHGLEATLADVAHHGTATVLGAGATARSALVALAGLGVERVRLAVRSEPRRETVELAVRLGLALHPVALGDWPRSPGGVVISTLPAGPSADVGAALDAVDPRGRGGHGLSGVTLLDVVYADWPTPLARCATRHGLTVVSGLEMLVHQAAEQFRLFTGRPAPVAEMLIAGRQALGR